MSRARIRAILIKELRDYRRNGNVIATMAILPVIFIISPLAQIFTLSADSAPTLLHKEPLLYMLGIPALVPAALAASAVVSERVQGTLEPILTTPLRREEFLIAKALSVLVPALVISYVVFGLSIIAIKIFAAAPVASAVLRGPEVLAQFVFTPLIAIWSIWVGIAVSTRAGDTRVAQQLSMLGSLPVVAVTILVSFNVIPASHGVAVACGAALVLVDSQGWRLVSRLLDRERLITGTKS